MTCAAGFSEDQGQGDVALPQRRRVLGVRELGVSPLSGPNSPPSRRSDGGAGVWGPQAPDRSADVGASGFPAKRVVAPRAEPSDSFDHLVGQITHLPALGDHHVFSSASTITELVSLVQSAPELLLEPRADLSGP